MGFTGRKGHERLVRYASQSLTPAFWAVCLYRVSHTLHRRGIPLAPALVSCLSRVLTSSDIDYRAEIGPGLVVFHGAGLVVGASPGSRTIIGANCKLFQNVTLGVRNPRTDDDHSPAQRFPMLGNDVMVCAGAVVAGPIVVGDGATIGANAVVVEDVPPGQTVAGNPARPVGHAPHGRAGHHSDQSTANGNDAGSGATTAHPPASLA